MLLKIDGLKKNYGDFHLDCSLEVKKGRITGIIGANGAGKTTTFKAILGLIRPDGGSVKVLGKDFSEITKEDKACIGTVMAENGFSSMLKVNEIASIMDALYTEFQKEVIFEKCEHFQLPLNKPVKDFSTGMKAKLKVILAMSYEASLLILDEPTVGLDYLTRNELLDEMRDYMELEDRGMLISSHISEDLESICDDLYFLSKGTILLHEDTDKILSDYGVLKLSEEQYDALDKRFVSYLRKNTYGYELLTANRQFYADNYPELVLEKGSIDQVNVFLMKGERL